MIRAIVGLTSEAGMYRWELWRDDALMRAGKAISPYQAFIAAQEALTASYSADPAAQMNRALTGGGQ